MTERAMAADAARKAGRLAPVRRGGIVFAVSCLLAMSGIVVATSLPSHAQATPASNEEVPAAGLASGSQAYDGGTGTWDAGHDGAVRVSYGTVGGPWGQGRYVVTIPTKIAYDGMPAGTVSTSDDYAVNVRGAIGEDEQVMISAETGNELSGGSLESDIVETTTQGKSTWSADEVYGGVSEDDPNDPLGTSCTDTITLSGTARAASAYEGTVAYTARLGKGM